jgi:hypothetical protein
MSVYGEGLADLAFDGFKGGDLFLLEREVLFVSLVVGAGAKAAFLAKSSSCQAGRNAEPSAIRRKGVVAS